ncbi:hypothetical protein [Mycobacteroides abscessus]|uniref:hypothetical protein n=1 Tax=Mycobacteroides abscessus TaxID=36809 RepID=UPI000C25EC9A|nr:hypothetical protein [Mycobacteroides abscessus]
MQPRQQAGERVAVPGHPPPAWGPVTETVVAFHLCDGTLGATTRPATVAVGEPPTRSNTSPSAQTLFSLPEAPNIATAVHTVTIDEKVNHICREPKHQQ